ncbi:MAG: FtsX-like permease family protein, partial [Acidobacteriota bacterium]
LFGLAPALQAARTELNDGLKESRLSKASGRPRLQLRNALVVAEVAMALMLLIGAGLLAHSMVRLMNNRLGFEPAGQVRLQLRLGDDAYSEEQRVAFTRDLLERIEALPGVSSAAAGWTVPFDFTGGGRCCWRTRFTFDPEAEPVASLVHPITPGYFSSLGATVLEGRELTWQDDALATPVPVLLNRTMAARFFGGDSALGRQLSFKSQGEQVQTVVVGVVEDVRRWGLAAGDEESVYVPYLAFGGQQEDLKLMVRTEIPLNQAMADGLRSAVWDLDPRLPIASIVTMDQRISSSLTEPRFYSFLLGSFAVLALVLAAAGIASSLLYAVGRRSREMGIRIAVGAESGDLLQLVLRQGMALTGLGLMAGIAGATALSSALESMIYGITPTDPPTFLAVSALLALVALGACLHPAWRAASTDPASTLRAD